MTSLPPHSPAELLLLLQKYHNPNLRQLLRVTFLDLLRQQVLAISTEQYQPHYLDPVTQQQFVIGGPALASYYALPHEELLIDTLRTDDQLRIPFKQYVRMVFGKARSAPEYYKLVEASPRTGQLFSQQWFWRLTRIRYLTQQGRQMQSAMEAELVRLDKEFASRAASNAANAHVFSQQLGGAVFLLPSFTSELGRQLTQELRQIPEPIPDFTTDSDGGGDDGGTSWHTHADTFDSHSPSHGDSDSSSGDSGCGGDSGCSGCGGCGGD